MNRVVAVVLLFSVANVAACADSGEDMKARVSYWERTTVREIPVGSKRPELERWALSRKVGLNFYTSEHKAIGVLEIVPGDGIVCRDWSIVLSVPIDDDGTSTQHPVVTRTGTCL